MVTAAGGWRVIQDPPGEPQFNMDRDEALSRQASEESRPILRIYRWDRPAISLGRRQRAEELPLSLLQKGLPLVRRPTGGGAVLHRLDELTYSFSVPRALLPADVPLRETACLMHRFLRDVLIEQIGLQRGDLSLAAADPVGPVALCFSSPAKGDLLCRGRKMAGAALRVWHDRVLLQGSVQGLPMDLGRLPEVLIEAARRFSLVLPTPSSSACRKVRQEVL